MACPIQLLSPSGAQVTTSKLLTSSLHEDMKEFGIDSVVVGRQDQWFFGGHQIRKRGGGQRLPPFFLVIRCVRGNRYSGIFPVFGFRIIRFFGGRFFSRFFGGGLSLAFIFGGIFACRLRSIARLQTHPCRIRMLLPWRLGGLT